MKKNTTVRKYRSIRQQISLLFIAFASAAFLMMLILALMLVQTANQYNDVLKNAVTAADFNNDFKESLDQKMYNHVILPRSSHSAEDLPMEDLDAAESVLKRLQQTTSLTDNQWRIQSMLNMFESLRNYMVEIAETERYDTRMELLDRNIRGETGLTLLIETYMHDYIDNEVRDMARIQAEIRQRTLYLIVFAILGAAVLLTAALGLSVHLAGKITDPIRALSDKVKDFARGSMSWVPVITGITELKTLDTGFDEMAEQIDTLMKNRIEDQRSLHRAELELLQAQINPHFLYNTLDSIAILAESGRGDDAVNMVNSLSAFFRISLSKGKDIIPLRDEKQHVENYLQIQSIRYSDILSYRIDLPEELDHYMVPKLILQPLVENALYHGIKNKRGMGQITVTGEIADGVIRLHVTDNGAGMDPEQLEALRAGVYQDRHTGLGLVNVHKRIRLYCGESYGLTFDSEKGVGSTVTILLPLTLKTES